MSTATTSTNQPFSAVASTSSTPTAPNTYVPTNNQQTQTNDSEFSKKEILIGGAGLILSAVIGFFSSLLTVNSDISNNRENISVLKTEMNHLQEDFKKMDDDIEKAENSLRKVEIMEAKLSSLEKQIENHTNPTTHSKSTKK